jgi:hypothetical protein
MVTEEAKAPTFLQNPTPEQQEANSNKMMILEGSKRHLELSEERSRKQAEIIVQCVNDGFPAIAIGIVFQYVHNGQPKTALDAYKAYEKATLDREGVLEDITPKLQKEIRHFRKTGDVDAVIRTFETFKQAGFSLTLEDAEAKSGTSEALAAEREKDSKALVVKVLPLHKEEHYPARSAEVIDWRWKVRNVENAWVDASKLHMETRRMLSNSKIDTNKKEAQRDALQREEAVAKAESRKMEEDANREKSKRDNLTDWINAINDSKPRKQKAREIDEKMMMHSLDLVSAAAASASSETADAPKKAVEAHEKAVKIQLDEVSEALKAAKAEEGELAELLDASKAAVDSDFALEQALKQAIMHDGMQQSDIEVLEAEAQSAHKALSQAMNKRDERLKAQRQDIEAQWRNAEAKEKDQINDAIKAAEIELKAAEEKDRERNIPEGPAVEHKRDHIQVAKAEAKYVDKWWKAEMLEMKAELDACAGTKETDAQALLKARSEVSEALSDLKAKISKVKVGQGETERIDKKKTPAERKEEALGVEATRCDLLARYMYDRVASMSEDAPLKAKAAAWYAAYRVSSDATDARSKEAKMKAVRKGEPEAAEVRAETEEQMKERNKYIGAIWSDLNKGWASLALDEYRKAKEARCGIKFEDIEEPILGHVKGFIGKSEINIAVEMVKVFKDELFIDDVIRAVKEGMALLEHNKGGAVTAEQVTAAFEKLSIYIKEKDQALGDIRAIRR